MGYVSQPASGSPARRSRAEAIRRDRAPCIRHRPATATKRGCGVKLRKQYRCSTPRGGSVAWLALVRKLRHPVARDEKDIAALHLRRERIGAHLFRARHLVSIEAGQIADGALGGPAHRHGATSVRMACCCAAPAASPTTPPRLRPDWTAASGGGPFGFHPGAGARSMVKNSAPRR